jgi:DNA polymerase III subunit epsilon
VSTSPHSPWWDGPLAGLDLETTSPLPEEARIVTAAFVTVGAAADVGADPGSLLRHVESRTWLADPGVAIPEEATAVHGVTTEHAREHGQHGAEVAHELREALEAVGETDAPLIVFNARYDLTVLDREWVRRGVIPPPGFPWRVVDPFVLDKWLDRYRKSYPPGHDAESAKAAGVPSSRTLTGMCAHYRASLDGAHDAAFDALAAVRLAYRMAAHAEPVRRVRGRDDAVELAQLRKTWEAVRGDLDRLHKFQRGVALEERERFAEYKASIGEYDEAARIRAEVGWPVLDVPATAGEGR